MDDLPSLHETRTPAGRLRHIKREIEPLPAIDHSIVIDE
jgi:hypothetical protein